MPATEPGTAPIVRQKAWWATEVPQTAGLRRGDISTMEE